MKFCDFSVFHWQNEDFSQPILTLIFFIFFLFLRSLQHNAHSSQIEPLSQLSYSKLSAGFYYHTAIANFTHYALMVQDFRAFVKWQISNFPGEFLNFWISHDCTNPDRSHTQSTRDLLCTHVGSVPLQAPVIALQVLVVEPDPISNPKLHWYVQTLPAAKLLLQDGVPPLVTAERGGHVTVK